MCASDLYGVSSSYFEQEEHWSQDVSPFARNLMRKALEALPSGINSLLDIGCGAGEFCRMAAAKGFATVGLDLSFGRTAAEPGLPPPEGVSALTSFS